jgi:hypothetical protein
VRRLPDGSMLTLASVSAGKVHPYAYGTWWQTRLYPLLPPAVRDRSGWWSSRSGWQTGTYISPEPNALVIQAIRRGKSPRGMWPVVAVPVDERGREYSPGMLLAWTPVVTATGSVQFWDLPVFPRRGSTVGARLYAQMPHGPWVRVGEFHGKNPLSRSYPHWSPEPLPVTKWSGDLAMTLTGLTAGQTIGDPRHPEPPGNDNWTRAALCLTRNGRQATGWQPIRVALSDATGNQWSHRNQHWPPQSRNRLFEFAGRLPPGESAVKLRFEVMRTRGFGPDELWVARGVPVRPPDRATAVVAAARRQGAELSLTVLDARGPFGLGYRRGRPAPMLEVDLLMPPPDLRVTLLRATDDRGRTIPAFIPEPAASGGSVYRYRFFHVSPEARAMDLVFAVTRSRFFEFRVAPPAGA